MKNELVYHPHPALTTVAEPIDEVTNDLRDLARNMIRICLQHRGVGLAANQVGVPIRLIVAKTSRNIVAAYVNPVIQYRSGVVATEEEGCLSHPGVRVPITRSEHVMMSYRTLDGSKLGITRGAMGLEARCWQHEIDHLNGINIIDHRESSLSASQKQGESRP